MSTRITALYCTAFLTGWILHDEGIPAPVATQVRKRLEPDPTGRPHGHPAPSRHPDNWHHRLAHRATARMSRRLASSCGLVRTSALRLAD